MVDNQPRSGVDRQRITFAGAKWHSAENSPGVNSSGRSVMKIRSASWRLFVAVSAIMAVGTGAKTQTGSHTAQEAANPEKQQTLIHSVDGVDLYRGEMRVVPRGKWQRERASVSGVESMGAGPDDHCKENNGRNFPVARVRRIIIGKGVIDSHGSREMPVWGWIFSQVEADLGPRAGEAGEFGEVLGMNSVNQNGSRQTICVGTQDAVGKRGL